MEAPQAPSGGGERDDPCTTVASQPTTRTSRRKRTASKSNEPQTIIVELPGAPKKARPQPTAGSGRDYTRPDDENPVTGNPLIELTRTTSSIQRAVNEIEANNVRWTRELSRWLEATKKENEIWRDGLLESVKNIHRELTDKLAETEERMRAAEERSERAEKQLEEVLIELRKPKTYAEAARSESAPASSPPRTVDRTSLPRDGGRETLPGINIDLSRLVDKFDTQSTIEVKTRVQSALAAHEETRNITVKGISRSARDSRRVRVIMGSEEEARTARNNDKWVETHLQGSRLQGEQWYPIKVDHVDKLKITDDTRIRFKPEAQKMIEDENGGVKITKMKWLGKLNPDKLHGSLVIYLARKEDADKLLNRRIMEIGGEVAYPQKFERRQYPIRCYKCLEYSGHRMNRCTNETRCGNCAEWGHGDKECASQTTRCAACSETHKITDPGCPVYREELRNLTAQNE